MKNQCQLSTKNHYHIELCDAETGEVKQVVDCHNVVLNTYLDRLRTGLNSAVNTIYIGTGTNPPSAADTGLQTIIYWTNIGAATTTPTDPHFIAYSYPTAKRTMRTTIAAANSIGALTEIGVGYQYSSTHRPMTRALFVDSEGNPIVINKTATDILNITVTINYSFTLTPHPEEGVNVFLDNSPSNRPYRFLITGIAIYAPSVRPLAHIPREYKNLPHGNLYNTSVSLSGAIANGTLTGVIDYLYSADVYWNGGLGYDVKAISLTDIGVFKITPEIFPPTAFPKYQVGVGDGSNTDFNIKTQSCKEGTQKVYVDGVLQAAGVDYIFNPKNTKDFFTNYLSSNADYMVNPYVVITENSSSPYGGPGYPTAMYQDNAFVGVRINNNTPLVYDFETPVTINCLYLGSKLLSATKLITQLEYSLDGVTWTEYQQLSALAANSFNLLPEITARYWRYSTTSTTSISFTTSGDMGTESNQMQPLVLFGYHVPSIRFTTAPTSGAVIEIEYDLEYPFHNDKHSIRVGYTQEWLC